MLAVHSKVSDLPKKLLPMTASIKVHGLARTDNFLQESKTLLGVVIIVGFIFF